MKTTKFNDASGREVEYDKKGIITLLKQEYLRRKSDKVGKAVKLSQRTPNSVWETAAEYCIELQANPRMFVKAAFDKCSLLTGPYANMLGSKRAVQWYEQYTRTNNKMIEQCAGLSPSEEQTLDVILSECETVQAILTAKIPVPDLSISQKDFNRTVNQYEEAVTELLKDEFLQTSTISRAIVAKSLGLQSLATMLLNEALEAASDNPGQRKVIEKAFAAKI